MRRLTIFSTLALAALLGLSSCKDSGTDTQISGDLADPEVFEAAVRQTMLDGADGVLDAVQRLVEATAGGTPDGVLITPNATGADVSLSIDFNGDGTRESTVNFSITGTIQTGASVFIASMDVPQVPSLVGGGGATLIESSPGYILAQSAYANVSADPAGSGNAVDVSVGGDFSLDLVTGIPGGFATAQVSTDESTLFVSVSFEPDGSGGFRIRFTSSDFDFTVP
jgi:hypothetical protein